MDPLGVRRATRTRTGFARVAHSYDRHRAIVDGAFNAKSRRHNRRRMKSSRHRADSFLDSTRVGAPTSSNLSLSQFWTPIDSQVFLLASSASVLDAAAVLLYMPAETGIERAEE
jgi:hypothetical protein